jgi:lysophospholipase L1-like esterase
VLAFGDSITNGGGELQWGVALQSWALWTARALGLGYTSYAVDGAGVDDVLAEQLPAFRARRAHPQARYELGCLYIGVNDVRRYDWDVDAFRHAHQSALTEIAAHCDRMLTMTAPLLLGRPGAGTKVADMNAAVAANATAAGALLVDLSAFTARNHVMADRVHPTAFGQIAIAERVLSALAADTMTVRAWPADLIRYETSWRGRLRGDLTYAYRTLKELRRAYSALITGAGTR